MLSVQTLAKVMRKGRRMLPTLARAIHDDVRNNVDQEMNLSARPGISHSVGFNENVVAVVCSASGEDWQGHERAHMTHI
jgi:hypothetical protein